MGERMRAFDWAATPLGPVERWPQSLRTAVSICLLSRFTMWIGWGPELTYFYNDAYRLVLKAKHPWALGRPALEVWGEVETLIGPMLRSVLSTGQATWATDQLMLLERNGYLEETYFTFSYSPIRDESGGVGGVLTTIVETTEQVVGERRLRALRELGARTLDAATTGEIIARALSVIEENAADLPFCRVFLRDGEGGVRVAGATGAGAVDPSRWPLDRIAASGRGELLRDLPAGVDPGEAGATFVVPLLVDGAAPAGFLVLGVSPRRPFDEGYRAFLELAAGSIAAALAKAHAYEEERRRAEALAELDRAKTEFYGNVSHELRTPLTLILGPIDDARRAGERTFSEEALASLHRNASRLLRMVNALLEFSRVEAGRAKASRVAVDLPALTADVASAFRAAFDEAELSLTVDCPPLAAPAWVDREQWERIVLNLVSNAFKFTFAGGVRVSLRAEEGQAVLRVEDTGTGIPAAELPHLFERFHRVEGARSRTHEGTGIGLALVRELAAMHEGSVSVESEVGRGSTFTVRLPLVPRSSASVPPPPASEIAGPSSAVLSSVDEARRWLPRRRAAASPPASQTMSRHGGARVLLADDNADMRDYVARILGAQGFRVDAFPDGAAALIAAVADPPDLVLTDVMMPELDGFGLLSALRAEPRTRGVPVIMLSARAGEEARVEGFGRGADDYLIKPFSARELAARVASCVELSRLRRAAEAALHEAARRKDEFLAMLGHELRNPLAPIRMATALLAKQIPPDDKARRYLEVLDRQISALTRLVEDLLDVSRITRGIVELRAERVDLGHVAQRALEAARPLVEQRRHEVSVERPADPLPVTGDPVRLEQVVVNLLANAAKYTDPGGRIALSVRREGDFAVIRVADSGIGIAPEMLERVFDLFEQAGRGAERSQGGLGVGLTVARSLVERHGGTVEATSEGLGKGAVLTVRLPIAAADLAPPTDREPPRSAVTEGASRIRRVLVVDDNLQAAETLGALLADGGYEVTVAHDGPTALQRCEERPVDLAILDLGMPGMDGFEVARRLRERFRGGGPILVALTGYGGSAYRDRALAAGFDVHLLKPASAEAIHALLREARRRVG